MEPKSVNSSTIKQSGADQNYVFEPNLILAGYIFLFISFCLYATCEFFSVKENLFMIFWTHYFIGVAYTVILIVQGRYGIRKSWLKENINKTVIASNLYLISAYALNRELQVFENSADWFCIYILLASFTLLSFQYFHTLPTWIHKLQYFLLGSAIALYVYLSIYVLNFYFIGFIGAIALGIGIHIFVPVTLLISCIFLLKHNRKNPKAYYWTGAGILLVVCLVQSFVSVWTSRISKIEKYTNQSVMYQESELPSWVSIAQHIPNDWISQRILKSDLVYSTSNQHFFNWNFMPKSVSWDEVKKHDPLVFISSMIVKCSLTDEERVKILKAISNGRHQANERLWAGDNLTTSYIVSDIDIYTALRISYTEKYINVKNNSKKGRWRGNTEEGIYTFYLPEGSVITSLSLWINGKEEKGILTSKQKSVAAYNTIVGVEQRDPSVVHWQEGNTVTVRVFPCTTEEERKFKIGVTSPLVEEGGNTLYKNIIFDGPNPQNAIETKRIRFIGSIKDITLPNDFEKDKKGFYIAEQKYDPDFSLTFKSTPITANQFYFDGFVYSITALKQTYQPFTCKKIFLDINCSWTSAELNHLKAFLNDYELYVYNDDQATKLSNDNWDLTTEMLNNNFTVFPFHFINDPLHTLVVTKGQVLSPHLSDFNDSKFAESLSAFFSTRQKINVFNLVGETSTYINSLRELRGIEFASGTASDLTKMLWGKRFLKSEESNEKIILHDAKMAITRIKIEKQQTSNNAPDHLARLFAYNDIMRQVGTHYLNRDFINDELVNEAAKAYVVSPVSSLIVLETQEDYKRFDINDTDNSLNNAVKQSSGAVPEPHEWALIILFLLFMLYLQIKSKRLNTISSK